MNWFAKNIIFILILVISFCTACRKNLTKADHQGPKMVFVEGGTYYMGCQSEYKDSNCADLELPPHKVSVDDFYIGVYELSIEEFGYFIDATGYKTDAEKLGGSNLVTPDSKYALTPGVNWMCDEYGFQRPRTVFSDYPVGHISYNDAVAYCEWMSKRTGKHYRLPTEAEWEYAARGGQKTHGYQFSGSNTPQEVAWTLLDWKFKIEKRGLKSPNELGIYDMSGNVWEWCSDFRDYYILEDSINPQGPASGDVRVLRSGCIAEQPNRCCVWSRGSAFQDMRRDKYGVRIACDTDGW